MEGRWDAAGDILIWYLLPGGVGGEIEFGLSEENARVLANKSTKIYEIMMKNSRVKREHHRIKTLPTMFEVDTSPSKRLSFCGIKISSDAEYLLNISQPWC